MSVPREFSPYAIPLLIPEADSSSEPLAPPLETRKSPRPCFQRKEDHKGPTSSSDSVLLLPMCPIGQAEPGWGQTYQYWPFSSSSLYNWKAQNPPFSKDPKAVTDLVESIMICFLKMHLLLLQSQIYRRGETQKIFCLMSHSPNNCNDQN